MRKRLLLLLAYWVVLSLCLSPGITYVSPTEPSVPASALKASAGGLYVPPAHVGMQLAPTLTGSVVSNAIEVASAEVDREYAPLVVETPEADYITPQYDGDIAFMLRGSAEPGADIDLVINDSPSTRKQISADHLGRWQVGIAKQDLESGEVRCTFQYADAAGQGLTWRSRLEEDLPQLLMPAFLAAGTKTLSGKAEGDVRLHATVDGTTLPCLLDIGGGVSVSGVADLAVGAEILIAATDAWGNSVETVSLITKPDSALLGNSALAAPTYRFRPEEKKESAVATDEIPGAEGALIAQVPASQTVEPTQIASRATIQPDPVSTPVPELPRESPEPLRQSAQPQRLASAPTAAPDSATAADEAYFPPDQPRGVTVEAYATLEGLTLPELDEAYTESLFNASIRMRLRDMRKQMVLPIDLSKVGVDGLQIPLLARGYRVGCVWIDPALGISPDTGKEVDGYVFSLELEVGELMGRQRLQVVETPKQLDALKAQGWQPIVSQDSTFFEFDNFVEAQGVVLVYASVPIRFDTAQAELYRRDSVAQKDWLKMLPMHAKAQ